MSRDKVPEQSETGSEPASAGLKGNEYIGRRPIAAFGNSDGALEMLQSLGRCRPE
jgi:hypothetical protein